MRVVIKEALIYSLTVVPAKAGTQKIHSLDDLLRSPFGLPCGRSTRDALLSRLRGNDEIIRASLILIHSPRPLCLCGKNYFCQAL